MGLPKSNFASGYMKERPSEQDLFYVRLLVHMFVRWRALGSG